MNYITAESNAKPKLIDVQKTTVYIRKDLSFDQSTGFWTYQEAKMSPEEFDEYLTVTKAINAINGIDDSANISSILTGQENGDNNQLIIMEAIADLYDVIATLMQGGNKQ